MMGSLERHISEVMGLLNERAEYAVLRNYEGLPYRNESRDCDIIISRSSFNAMKKELVRMIDETGWKIVNYLNSDRLITFVCARVDGLEVSIMQWDFFFNTSVYGVLLMDAEEFLKHRKFNGFLYYVDVECEFLDKYLYNRAVGALYPEKYKATRIKAEESEIVKGKLADLFGCGSVEECDKSSSKKLLANAVWWNFKRNPLGLLCSVLLFLYTFIRNYLMSRTGFSIGFTGPDGSGKTTVIGLLIGNLGDVFRKAHVYCHFRPTLFGNIGEVAHSAGLKKAVDRDYDKPHRGNKTGKANSLCRLMYYSLDYVIGYWVKVKTNTRITRLVVFDRYYTDVICDSRRSRIYLSPKFLYLWKRLFIPSLDYNILLTADTERIVERKRELGVSQIETIKEKIRFLADKPGYKLFHNNATPQECACRILEYVFERQHEKNIRFRLRM